MHKINLMVQGPSYDQYRQQPTYDPSNYDQQPSQQPIYDSSDYNQQPSQQPTYDPPKL